MKILIAEDDAATRHLLESLLRKWHYQVELACDGAEAWRLLQEADAPELVILDWLMPGIDGIQVCRYLRELHKRSYTYVLLLTAQTLKQDIVAGIEAGADDYLCKPFDADELRARLRAGERILELHAQLLFQASHDALTGAWNRRAILDILQSELARGRRTNSPVAVVMLDLDHFKAVNDTHGHPAGDAVLRETSRRIGASVRIYDSVSRYGGEEFLIVLPGCGMADAQGQAERLCAAIRGRPIEMPEGAIVVTASAGVVVSAQLPDANFNSLLAAADAALYHAKNLGRNRVELADVGRLTAVS